MSILRKLKTAEKILKNGITKPEKKGEKILLLLSAPSAQYYFDYESVQNQFIDYDLAVVNFMPHYSKREMQQFKPKYVIAIDPGLYSKDYLGINTVNHYKESIEKALEEFDWRCYLVTSVLEEFEISNTNINKIHMSLFTTKYKRWMIGLCKRNIVNFGMHNVIQGALYFAMTFGYKEIAILGCPYRSLNYYMETDGLHIDEHNHYYELNRDKIIIPNEQLAKRYKQSYSVYYHRRALESSLILYYLSEYAKRLGVNVTNYSEGSMITSIKMGKLDLSSKKE